MQGWWPCKAKSGISLKPERAVLKFRSWPRHDSLVGHGVYNVVDSNPQPERGKLLRVLRIIRMLPGISQVRVVHDGNHQPVLVVVDTAPFGANSIAFEDPSRPQILLSGDLVLVVQIVDDVED